ncbi:MAG: hypothetical protein D6B25_16170 [Desulfobulbaceae bacterium]|nr:MAG: hypothetical protein D6B25_16170 [Desulfobulbaceae bacterium]
MKQFIDNWVDDANSCKIVFNALYKQITTLDAEYLEFHVREGVTYSLRGLRTWSGVPRIFVMIDVIEDQPRWLSVCFYGMEVTDPAGYGDYVPGGLLGEDGICFDIDSNDQELVMYVKERIIEAYNHQPDS